MPRQLLRRLGAPLATALVALGILTAGAATPATSEPADVVLVTPDCASGNFLCPAFAAAAKRTGTRARIISPDGREDIVGTLSLLAQQGHDLVIADFGLADQLAEVAPRFPDTRFALYDAPLGIVDGRPRNVAAILLRPHESAFLAGWLAARLEKPRQGADIVGVVAGERIPPVEEFVIGFRAGARLASPGGRVLVGYSNDFVNPAKCAAIARRQIAQGAGAVFDVAGGCGPGTLAAAKAAGVWGIGVDFDRSGLGPFILTSVIKRYDRGFAILMRGARSGRLGFGKTTILGLESGGTELGRISPRVPSRVLREVAAVRERIVSGRIRVPGAKLL